MMLNDFNPSIEEMLSDKRILWNNGDIWQTDSNGVPHRRCTKYGDKLTIKLPDSLPAHYKGRKATGALIYCNACELVTGVEIYYGRPSVRGYALAFDGNLARRDVTDYYRR